MTAATITPTTSRPVEGAHHVAAFVARTAASPFSEVREAHRGRVLAVSAILTGIAAVSVSAVAAIALAITP